MQPNHGGGCDISVYFNLKTSIYPESQAEDNDLLTILNFMVTAYGLFAVKGRQLLRHMCQTCSLNKQLSYGCMM